MLSAVFTIIAVQDQTIQIVKTVDKAVDNLKNLTFLPTLFWHLFPRYFDICSHAYLIILTFVPTPFDICSHALPWIAF